MSNGGTRARQLSQRYVVDELRPRINILSDPIKSVMEPDEAEVARQELKLLLGIKGVWEAAHGSYATQALGNRRMEWLEEFLQHEMEEAAVD